MKIDRIIYDDLLTLRPHGRIDTLSAEEFRSALLDAFKENENLIIDLAETEYISSSGLRVFLEARKMVSDKGAFSIINTNICKSTCTYCSSFYSNSCNFKIRW